MKNVKRRNLIIIALVLVAAVITFPIHRNLDFRADTTRLFLHKYDKNLMKSQGTLTLHAYNGDEIFVRVDNCPINICPDEESPVLITPINSYREFKEYVQKYTDDEYYRYLKDLYPRSYFINHTLIVANIIAYYDGYQYSVSLDPEIASLGNPFRKGNVIRLIECGLAPDRIHNEVGSYEMIYFEIPRTIGFSVNPVEVVFYSSVRGSNGELY